MFSKTVDINTTGINVNDFFTKHRLSKLWNGSWRREEKASVQRGCDLHGNTGTKKNQRENYKVCENTNALRVRDLDANIQLQLSLQRESWDLGEGHPPSLHL